MITKTCDKCGIRLVDTKTRRGKIESYWTVIAQTSWEACDTFDVLRTEREYHLCNDCKEKFDSWLKEP